MPESPLSGGMGLALPTPGDDDGVWDDELNTALTAVNSHNHTPGLGELVPSAGLNINADLSFNGHSALHIKSIDGDEVSITSGSRRMYWSSSDHELYIRDANGIAIKVTSSGQLNVSAVGGIGGDYAGIGALVSYVDGSDIYKFQQQVSSSIRQWARIAGADLDLYEYHPAGNSTNVVNRVRLSSPASLASSYALTLPAALPASQALVQVDASGAMSLSNTLPNPLHLQQLDVYDGANGHRARIQSPATLAGDYSIITPTALPGSKALMMIDSAGQITATNPVATDYDIQLSGTGKLKHDTWSHMQTILPSSTPFGSCSSGVDSGGRFSFTIMANGTTFYHAIQRLCVNDIVSSFTVMVCPSIISGTGNLTLDIVSSNNGLGLASLLSAPVITAGGTVSLPLASPVTIMSGYEMLLKVVGPAGGSYSLYTLETFYSV